MIFANSAILLPLPKNRASPASLRLHLFQPPLSQQIQALEWDLGVQLLERDKRNVALTEPGRVFLEQAQQIPATVQEARRHVVAAAEGHSGQLRLAYTVSLSFHPTLPQSLLRYRLLAPNLHLHLTEIYIEQQLAPLLTGLIDLGFVRAAPSRARDAGKLQVRLIDREAMLLAIPPEQALTRPSSLQRAEVAHDAFLTAERAGGYLVRKAGKTSGQCRF